MVKTIGFISMFLCLYYDITVKSLQSLDKIKQSSKKLRGSGSNIHVIAGNNV